MILHAFFCSLAFVVMACTNLGIQELGPFPCLYGFLLQKYASLFRILYLICLHLARKWLL